MLTETEALELVKKALAMHDARRPVPSGVDLAEAAEMLGVSERTVQRLKPPRNGAGKIPYEWVLEQLAVR